MSDAEKGDAVLNLWANYDKYDTLKDVAKSINKPYGSVSNWIYAARNISSKIKSFMASGNLTNEHVYQLVKYSHGVQNKLADVIIRKKISSHKDVLRPFLRSFDADPNANLRSCRQGFGNQNGNGSKKQVAERGLRQNQ